MKRKTMYVAMALAAALAAGALAGCAQKAPSGSSPAPDASPATSAPATSEQATSAPVTTGLTTDEVIADLRNAAANAPEFKSVTVNETTEWTYIDEETGRPEIEQATGVYKFDINGDQQKQSVTAEYDGLELQYFVDGDKAVYASGGTAYSGTAEQFGAQDYTGFNTYISHVVGDLEALVSCAASAEKFELTGSTSYLLTLDPEKYIATDELLTALAEVGYPVKEALLNISFDEKGNVDSINIAISFEDSSIVETLVFSDFDSTVVDPAPEAAVTYEEMDEDVRQQIEVLMKSLDSYEGSAKGATATDAAKAN